MTYLTSSRMVVGGNSGPYCFPVSGLMVTGEAEPYGEPRVFAHIIKKRFGSKAFPRPIRGPHLVRLVGVQSMIVASRITLTNLQRQRFQ